MDVVEIDAPSVDRDTIPAKKGGALVGFDGYKRVKGTKVHAVIAEGSLPVADAISSARIHGGKRLISLMESISIKTGSMLKKRPSTIYADTKYGMSLNRLCLDNKQVRSWILDLPNRKKKSGRPRFLDRETYHRVRYNMEGFFGWQENYG